MAPSKSTAKKGKKKTAKRSQAQNNRNATNSQKKRNATSKLQGTKPRSQPKRKRSFSPVVSNKRPLMESTMPYKDTRSPINFLRPEAAVATNVQALLIEENNVKWSDVIGLDESKYALKESVIFPSKFPKLYGEDSFCGILLFGPPGTGKSLLAKALASEAKSSIFISITCSSLLSKFVGDSEKLERKIFIGLPTLNDRVLLLKHYLEKNKHCLTDEDVFLLAEKTEGFTGADISTFVKYMKMRVRKRIFQSTHFKRVEGTFDAFTKYLMAPCKSNSVGAIPITWEEIEEESLCVPFLTLADGMETLLKIKASNKEDDAQKYQQFLEQFGEEG